MSSRKRSRAQSVHERSASTFVWWPIAVLAVACFVTYWNSVSGPFIFDDELSVTYNDSIRQWWRIGRVLFPDRDSSVAGRPLVNISFAINYALGGGDVFGYHLWNIAIHLLCALVLFGIVRRTLRSINLAFAAALVWMLHPLNSEAVNYLTQRTESMMALFYLLTLYASIRAASAARPARWQTAAVAACAAGMGCKESMVTAPLMVVLYDRIFLFGSFKDAVARRWRLYAGLAATWVLLAASIWSGPRGQSAGFSNDVRPWTYLLNQTIMITQYLRRAIWPRSLVIIYGWPLPLTLADVAPYALFVVVLIVLAVVMLVTRPKLGFLCGWFFVTLAPTSSIVPIATEVGAERRMYLPLTALVVLAVIGADRAVTYVASTFTWTEGRPARLAFSRAPLLIVVATALAAATIDRNREYASGLSLMRTVVDRWPTSPAQHMLGGALIGAGYHEEAVPLLRAAIAGAPRARYELGLELFNEGKLDEAIEQLSALIDTWSSPPPVHPHWQPPLRIDVVAAHEIIGRAYAKQKQWPKAIDQFEQALALDPSNVDVHKLIAGMHFEQQAFDEAIVEYRTFLNSRPNDPEALGNVGIALAVTNKLDDAIAAFRHAVEVDPKNGGAQRNLANALFDAGKIDEASAHAREAIALRPADASAHDLLGRTLALQGKFEEAAVELQRAAQLDPASAEIQDHLKRLQQLTAARRR
jgi:tetratricopeptide (TPR) repeat protein